MKKTGLTLIELIIVIALVVIVIGAVGLVFRQSLEYWGVGEAEVFLQNQAEKMMEEMLEGTDMMPAIREALEAVEATDVSFSFVSLWVDSYNDYKGDSGEFSLSRAVKLGGALPIGQIKTPNSKNFVSIPTVFTFGKERKPGYPDDKLRFINPIPKGSDVRILFHPDFLVDSTVIMRYYWDSNLQRVFRSYNGITEDVIKRDKKTKVINFKFSYYDNLNHQLEPVYGSPKSSAVSSSRSSPLSAIGVDFVLEKNSVTRELSSFVGARALGGNLGAAVSLSEGVEIAIPNSKNIRTLVLDNLGGIEENNKLELEIESSFGSAWKISIDFGFVNSEPYILGFNVDYPKGSTVYSSNRKQPVKGGLNLLKFGNDYYDYDDDVNVEDVAKIEGDEAKLKITKMDIGSAAVFIRP